MMDICPYAIVAERRHESNRLWGGGKLVIKPINGGNPDLASFTPRELIEELKARGYKGKLVIEREITL